MSFNLLHFQTKRVRARADVTLSRGRILRGPVCEIVYTDEPTWVPVRIVRNKALLNASGLSKHQSQRPYYTRLVSPGEECEVDQVVAYNLCIKEGLAALVSGGAFTVTDGDPPLVEWWTNRFTRYGQLHELF